MEQKFTLQSSLRYLKGVGPERHKILAKLELETLEDLFYFFPRRYENRFPIRVVSSLEEGEKQCVRGAVESRSLLRLRGGRTIFRLVMREGGRTLFASWFNQPYLAKIFQPRTEVLLYGKVEPEGRQWKMLHPEYELVPQGQPATIHNGRIVPVYPLTEDLSQKGLRQLVYHLLDGQSELLREYLPIELKRRLSLPDYSEAMRQIHFPDSEDKQAAARRRLVFDEFFLMQLAILRKKALLTREDGAIAHRGGEESVKRFIDGLDFRLTAGQAAAVKEIVADMKKARPMSRLVQGDVGSGKTAVAAAALLFSSANGFQGALMAPTEALARQHAYNLSQFLEPFGAGVAYLAQGMTPAEREGALARLASGEARIAVGTHALIQQSVRFQNLGLVVIDEQHKFGVVQRALLKEKAGGRQPHALFMTATPIPRTLAMTLYGDLDVSVMADMPKGRQPVKTFWVGEDKRAEVYALVERLVGEGRQAFVVCPLIRAGSITSKSVIDAHKELGRIFAHRRVGLLHGRLGTAEKEKVMAEFKAGKIDVLVSTVVIEVGIDVPNASLLVVENAERFGLAQLHQLRGRVGRGGGDSFCVLFSDAADEETAERLGAFETTASGFAVAERDLEIRGAGDVLGAKQHGMPELRIGDLAADASILFEARNEAKRLLSEDPAMTSAAHGALKAALRRRFGAPDSRTALSA